MEIETQGHSRVLHYDGRPAQPEFDEDEENTDAK